MKKERLEYIDVARSIAIISVVTAHAMNRSFNISSNTQAEFQSMPLILTIIKGIVYAMARIIPIPFFLMITGALLLPRDYSKKNLNHFIKHNWLNLFITTEIWMVIMFWYRQLFSDSVLLTEGVKQCVLKFLMTICFINPDTFGIMWYMPMILCVYLMIPIFSVALKNIPHKYFILPSTLIIFSSFVIPTVNGILLGMGSSQQVESEFSSANLFCHYMLLVLIGYFIREGYLKKNNSKLLIFVGCLSVGALCGLLIWSWSTEFGYQFGNGSKDIFVLIGAPCFFELLRRASISPVIRYLSSKLSEISFGIYFLHICIIHAVNIILVRYATNITHFSKVLILGITTIFGCVLVIQLLRKNKILGRYLFGLGK